VFLDFDDDDNDRVRLKRISFDGYGCCELGGEAASMDGADSRIFKESIVGHIADQSRLTLIIRKTIKDNRNLIWADALREYGFFDGSCFPRCHVYFASP
jgi:hypothetical protein